MCFNTIDQRLSCSGNTTTYYNGLRINNAGKHGKGTSQLLSNLIHNFCSQLIPFFVCIQNIFRRKSGKATKNTLLISSFHNSFCHTYNACCRCVLFQTASVSTVAFFCLIMLDCCMTNLSSSSMGTGNNSAIQNNSASNTSAKGNHNYIFSSCCRALPGFAESSYVGIITCHRWKTCQLCQLFGHRFKSPEEIYCTQNLTFIIDRSRNANSHTIDFRLIQLSFFDLIQNCFRNIRKYGLTVILLTRRNFPLFHQNTICLKKSAFYRSTTYVNSKTILSHISLHYLSF